MERSPCKAESHFGDQTKTCGQAPATCTDGHGRPLGRPGMANESHGKIIAGRLLSLELGLAFCPAMMCPGKPLETVKRLQS